MTLQFPANPPYDGFEWTDPSNGVTYVWNEIKNSWTAQGGTGGGGDVEEAPIDGVRYSRKDASWDRNDVWSVNGQQSEVILDAASVGAATEDFVLEEIGKINAGGILFRGLRDVTTQDPPADTEIGDMWEAEKAGSPTAAWNGITDKEVKEFQNIILGSDGNWILGTVGQDSGAFRFRGGIDCTVDKPPADVQVGDIFESTAAGPARDGWGSLEGTYVEQYQNIILASDGEWFLGAIVAEGIPEAPTDGYFYGRQSVEWERGVEEDTQLNVSRVRYNGGWKDESVSSVNHQTGEVQITPDGIGAATPEFVLEEIAKIESGEFQFKGLIDVTTEDPPADSKEGDIWEASVAGIVKSSWTSSGGKSVQQFQMLILTTSGDWILAAVMDGDAGIPDAPNDGKAYVRQYEDWVDVDEVVQEPDINGELTGRFVTRVDQPGTFEQIYGKKIFRDLISFDASTASVTSFDRNVFIDFPSNISLFDGGTQGLSKYQFIILRDRRANASADKNGLYLGFEDLGSTSATRVGVKCVPESALDVLGRATANNFKARQFAYQGNSDNGQYVEYASAGITYNNKGDISIKCENQTNDRFLNFNTGVYFTHPTERNRIRFHTARITEGNTYWNFGATNNEPCNLRRDRNHAIRITSSTDTNYAAVDTPNGDKALEIINLLTPRAHTDLMGYKVINLNVEDVQEKSSALRTKGDYDAIFHTNQEGELNIMGQSLHSLQILAIQKLAEKIETLTARIETLEQG